MAGSQRIEKRHFVISEPNGAKAPFDSHAQAVLDRVSKETGETPVTVQSRPNLGTLSVEASTAYLTTLGRQPEIVKAIEPAVDQDILIRPVKVKKATLKEAARFKRKRG